MATVRIGLLGCGKVGRAVARATVSARDRLAARGLELTVACALVRDVRRPRDVEAATPPLVDDVETFFARAYDVVVEVLGGVEPARTLVARALDRGLPVVTANKSLVAADGQALRARAARRGVTLRYEAAALAGVPFIDTLARRPLAATVSRLSAIVNGTSHYVITAMDREQLSFADALDRARRLGLTEPDPSNDIDGRDAAEKLSLLGAHVGAPGLVPGAIETTGIDALEPGDLAGARRLGGVVKPIAYAAIEPAGVRAFVGPAFLDERHPLAALEGCLNGIRLEGRFVGDLFYSGPGAGPDVTAATILDDVVETVASETGRAFVEREGSAGTPCEAPETSWLARIGFRGEAPDGTSLAEFLGAHRIWIRRSEGAGREPNGAVRRILTHRCSRLRLERALAALRAAADAETFAIRALEA